MLSVVCLGKFFRNSLNLFEMIFVCKVSNCGLTGNIPETLWDISSLQRLKLNSNQFSGPISAKIGGLRQILDFEVGENALTGQIPIVLGRLSTLGK